VAARKFDRPDEVLLDRRPNPHVGFGAGPHRCLGAHLVKTEVQVVLEEVLRRWESFEVDDRSKIVYQLGQARNIKRLPLVLKPTTA
jgi:cytochrome P450